jgi:hypothetical protein
MVGTSGNTAWIEKENNSLEAVIIQTKGRPKKKWEDVLQDLQIMKIKSCKTCVRWKEQWKEIVELAKTHSG